LGPRRTTHFEIDRIGVFPICVIAGTAEHVLTERMLTPLKISETTFSDNSKHCCPVRTSVDDLMKFVAASLEPERTPWPSAFDEMQTPRVRPHADHPVAMGWDVRAGGILVQAQQHEGQSSEAAGAMDRARRTGVVVYSTTHGQYARALALSLLDTSR